MCAPAHAVQKVLILACVGVRVCVCMRTLRTGAHPPGAAASQSATSCGRDKSLTALAIAALGARHGTLASALPPLTAWSPSSYRDLRRT
jgi:hypothetical protein